MIIGYTVFSFLDLSYWDLLSGYFLSLDRLWWHLILYVFVSSTTEIYDGASYKFCRQVLELGVMYHSGFLDKDEKLTKSCPHPLSFDAHYLPTPLLWIHVLSPVHVLLAGLPPSFMKRKLCNTFPSFSNWPPNNSVHQGYIWSALLGTVNYS